MNRLLYKQKHRGKKNQIWHQRVKGRLSGIQEQETSHESTQCAGETKCKNLAFLVTQVFKLGKCSSQISRTEGNGVGDISGDRRNSHCKEYRECN